MTLSKTDTPPKVIWTSSPVLPGEAFMLAGGNFGASPEISGAESPDASVQTLPLLQNSGHTLKVELPLDWKPGVHRLMVSNGERPSDPVWLNAPEAWWACGDQGDTASPGGVIRVFGRCLKIGHQVPLLRMEADSGEQIDVTAEEADRWSLRAGVPKDIQPGFYHLSVHNGSGGEEVWRSAGLLAVRPPCAWKETVFNVRDFPGTATEGVRAALDAAEDQGGGMVYFPRGRYRMEDKLTIPEGVTLKGASRESVSLYWPARREPMDTLIQGGDRFRVEELTIYTDGIYRSIVTGNSDVTIHRIRLRANLFHLNELGQSSRTLDRDGLKVYGLSEVNRSGEAIVLTGDRFQITENDLYHTRDAIHLIHGRYGVVSGNRFDLGYSPMQAYGVSNLVWEDNEYIGSDPRASGIGISTFHDSASNHHIYFARNRLRQMYGNDRESVTMDGHGTAYLGGVTTVEGLSLTLQEAPVWGTDNKDMLPDWRIGPKRPAKAWDWRGLCIYVVDGYGVGQIRNLVDVDGAKVTVDRAWDLDPDETSVLSIGKYNGRHLFVDNEFEDAAFGVQLYAPCCETVVAGNVMRRSGSHNAKGHYTKRMRWGWMRVEPAWFNQFLDNRIEEGNAWAAMGSEIRVYGINTESEWPITRWQTIQRNALENNAVIRVLGAVEDVLVTHNLIRDNEEGIVVNSFDSKTEPDIALLAQNRRDDPLVGETPSIPSGVLLCSNRFEAVDRPCTGDALVSQLNLQK